MAEGAWRLLDGSPLDERRFIRHGDDMTETLVAHFYLINGADGYGVGVSVITTRVEREMLADTIYDEEKASELMYAEIAGFHPDGAVLS